MSLAADPATGRQPLIAYALSNLDGSGAAATATLAAGDRKQLNLTVRTLGFPGNNLYVRPTVTITLSYPGYSGGFLSYVVPVAVWDGNGAGP